MTGLIILIGIMLLICPPFGLVCILSAIIVATVCSVQKKQHQKQIQNQRLEEYHSAVYDDITNLVEQNRQRAELDRQQRELEAMLAAQHKEEQKQFKIEQKQASAQSTIDFYEPYLSEQKQILNDLIRDKERAELQNKCDLERKLTAQISRQKQVIFRAEKKLEQAFFILEYPY